MKNTMDRDDGGVLDEWIGWFKAVPPLIPMALGCATALSGSVVTFSKAPEWVSGLFALAVALLLGWAANQAVRAWLAGIGSSLQVVFLLVGISAVQVFSAFLIIPGGWTTSTVFAITPGNWGSMRLLATFLAIIPVIGAVLVALPKTLRKIVIVGLAAFHFGGIMTAVTAVEPPGSTAPWLSAWLWGKVYRPYLQFFYLNNAYHFYSPEPGPPVLVWFRIDYTDNKSMWYRIPNDEDKVPLLYFRQLSLTELGTNQALPYVPNNYGDLMQIRNAAGLAHDPPIPPLLPDMSTNFAYRQPHPRALDTISSYIRHVAHRFPHPSDNPKAEIKQIRMYRVTHLLLSVEQFKKGIDPKAPSTYLPYFYGDYDKEGKLINPNDGMLWFSLPIYNEQELRMRNPNGHIPEVLDYFRLHSGLDITKEKQQ